jgi:2-methylcitrate dehydratase PrpD
MLGGERATPYGAAFVNSALMHARLQEDAYHTGSHPGVMIIPAALAVAETRGLSGRDLITAVVAGYEIEAAMTADFIPRSNEQGFRSSPTYGPFGAAMGAGRALGLSEVQATQAIGVAATFARVPLTYRSFGSGAGCASCDADASVTQILAMFHNGGSTLGFHQVLEIAAGATAYSSFRERDSGTKLPPTSPDFDLTFSFGYGFGFGVTQNLQVQIVQDFGLALHQSTGLAGGESRTAQLYVTRIGARYALGR